MSCFPKKTLPHDVHLWLFLHLGNCLFLVKPINVWAKQSISWCLFAFPVWQYLFTLFALSSFNRQKDILSIWFREVSFRKSFNLFRWFPLTVFNYSRPNCNLFHWASRHLALWPRRGGWTNDSEVYRTLVPESVGASMCTGLLLRAAATTNYEWCYWWKEERLIRPSISVRGDVGKMCFCAAERKRKGILTMSNWTRRPSLTVLRANFYSFSATIHIRNSQIYVSHFSLGKSLSCFSPFYAICTFLRP